ncbi:transmembrane anchored protein [Dolichospermum sp. UHCC 0260]|nr:transmembrane anchored protein [Dolichospermum sp. UHCC 0260]
MILTLFIVSSCSVRTSSNTSSSGNCQNPDDIAADGSRCGGRAASVRPGGN